MGRKTRNKLLEEDSDEYDSDYDESEYTEEELKELYKDQRECEKLYNMMCDFENLIKSYDGMFDYLLIIGPTYVKECINTRTDIQNYTGLFIFKKQKMRKQLFIDSIDYQFWYKMMEVLDEPLENIYIAYELLGITD